MTPQLLVVAATAVEAVAVPASVDLVITGVGKTAAATATARALAGYPDPAKVCVLNLGSAGALRPGRHGIYEPGVVLNHEISAAAIRSIGLDPQERLVVSGDPSICLATGDTFVTDPAVRDRLAEQADLVDMEGYAVAYAAQNAGAAVHLVKHVSDTADESAMSWSEVVHMSAQALGEWLVEHLDAGTWRQWSHASGSSTGASSDD